MRFGKIKFAFLICVFLAQLFVLRFYNLTFARITDTSNITDIKPLHHSTIDNPLEEQISPESDAAFHLDATLEQQISHEDDSQDLPHGAGFYLRATPEQPPRRPQTLDCEREDQSRASCCSMLAFWGGGKSGSSTLAVRLKHAQEDPEHWDSRGAFSDAPKEVCWAGRAFSWSPWRQCHANCSKSKPMALDACPRYHHARHALSYACQLPETKWVMLVRDPIERLVSRWNDDNGVREHSAIALEEEEKDTDPELDAWINSDGDGLSNYHDMLTTLLTYFDPSRIVILFSEKQAYESEAECIDVLNELHRWLGLVPKNECIMEHANRQQHKQAYKRPSREALASAIERWRPRNEAFFRLIGRNITWINF